MVSSLIHYAQFKMLIRIWLILKLYAFNKISATNPCIFCDLFTVKLDQMYHSSDYSEAVLVQDANSQTL
jgi:hypothetical protein